MSAGSIQMHWLNCDWLDLQSFTAKLYTHFFGFVSVCLHVIHLCLMRCWISRCFCLTVRTNPVKFLWNISLRCNELLKLSWIKWLIVGNNNTKLKHFYKHNILLVYFHVYQNKLTDTNIATFYKLYLWFIHE